MSRCALGCSWQARLAVAGTNGNGHTLPRYMLPRLADLLPLVPVRCFFDGEVLRHPGVERDRNGAVCRIAPIEPEQIVGVVERVWIDSDLIDGVLHFVTETVAVRRALLRMERDRALHAVGVSIVASGAVPVFTSIESVHAVDLVSVPAFERCHLIQRRSCSGWPQHVLAGRHETARATSHCAQGPAWPYPWAQDRSFPRAAALEA